MQTRRARSLWMRGTGDGTLGDRRGMDPIELRKVFVEVRLAQRGDRTLIRSLAVAAVNFLHHVHAGNHLAEGGKAHLVELGVVPGVDEKLRGACVLARRGKGNVARLVALRDGIVLKI